MCVRKGTGQLKSSFGFHGDNYDSSVTFKGLYLNVVDLGSDNRNKLTTQNRPLKKNEMPGSAY